MYILYLLGYRIARSLPLKFSYKAAEIIARVYLLFAKRDRREMSENLKVVLGENVDKATINKNISLVFKNFAKYLVDFFRFQKFSREYISENIELAGIENLEEALSDKRGVIALSLHLGNWEMAGAIMGTLTPKVTAIVLEHSNKKINEFFINRRAVNNLQSIPLGTQIKECFKALKQNEVIGIVGDKDYTSSGIPVDFFGRKALLPKGPAALSVKTGATIVFMVLTREKDDSFRMCFEKPIKPVSTGNYAHDLRDTMDRYIKLFEKYIYMYPDQWYAFRNIWTQQ